jgi:alpha-tubulin suppressor-like RCC1 family protein
MLYVSPVRILSIFALILASAITGCNLELTRDLSTAALRTAPSAASISGVTGGSDLTLDAKLYDGLFPTLTWSDSTGETSYEVSILDSTGATTVCGPQSVAADTTTYAFSSGCALTNGATYKALVKAVWSDGTTTVSTDSPLLSFQTGPFVLINSATAFEYGVATIPVSLNQAAAVPVTVDYVTADQTAFGGTDYIPQTTTTLTFAPGEVMKTLSVPIYSNYDDDGDRVFRLELSSSNSGSIETTTASITIQDDDLAPLAGVVSVSGGNLHTCSVFSSGAVKCWGWNLDGQLGDGSTTMRFMPVDVSGLSSGVAAISPAGGHTCALLSTGAVKCWGLNSSGQLGDSSTTNRITPVDVTGLASGVVEVASGAQGGHTCALLSTGAVKCWGNNFYGQLGDGSTTNRDAPANVVGLSSGVAAITAGEGHTCALLSTGAVKCWGYNSSGQLGDSSTINRITPVDVTGLASGVSAIAAGMNHTCAILNTGAVKCWGANVNGQLGDNSTSNRTSPVDTTGLVSGASSITTGMRHTCALLSTGAVKCWGDNAYSQIGDATFLQRNTPVDVLNLSSGVSAISAGSNHTCALLSDGTLKCWGSNSLGQLGDGFDNSRLSAIDVAGLSSGVSMIAAGGTNGPSHNCAIMSTGGVSCWGHNSWGQLGDGSSTMRRNPTGVSGLNSGVSAVIVGGAHSCALLSSGAVKCWGNNGAGQLGDNSTTNRNTPVDVSGLSTGVIALAAGEFHTCALLNTGAAKCWGGNGYGQIGDNSYTQRLTPTDVTGLASGVAGISAGSFHNCAVLTTGALRCWGSNSFGQLGDNSTTQRPAPVNVSSLSSGVSSVTLSEYHTCAVLNSGAAKCWGFNSDGQLGDNSMTTRLTPVNVSGLSTGVSELSAYNGMGSGYTCALLTSGGVKCWGNNSWGQLGDNTTITRLTPVDVSGLASGVSAISAGSLHMCALLSVGAVKCWGDNPSGILGEAYHYGVPQFVRSP